MHCQRMKRYSLLRSPKMTKKMLPNTHPRLKRHEHKETNGVPANEKIQQPNDQQKNKQRRNEKPKRNQRRNDKQRETNRATTNKNNPTMQQQIKRPQKRNDEHKIINGTTTNTKNATAAHRHRETAPQTVITNRHHGPAIKSPIKSPTKSHTNQNQITHENTMKTLFRK